MVEFVRLRFTGGRFVDPSLGMPVELLADLTAYRELLLGIARRLYLQKHPNRKRVPKRFEDGLCLRLKSIEAGSVVPVLERPVGETFDLGDDIFEESQKLLEQALDGSEDNALLQLFSSVPSGPLKAFVRDLSTDEMVEVLRPGVKPGSGIWYGRRQRSDLLRRLLPASDEPYEGIVRVVGLATDSQRVTFRDDVDSSFSGSYEHEQFEGLRNGLDADGFGDRFLVHGIAQMDHNGGIKHLRTIVSIENVEVDLACYAILRESLNKIRQLEEGWLDGDGVSVDDRTVNIASDLLDALCDDRQPPPAAVSATLEGAVRLEWHMFPRVTSIDCETDGSIELVSTLKGGPSALMTFDTVVDCVKRLNEARGVLDAG
ncbi:MAG: hypothetical protein WBD02_02690 [Acidimicrobiia bacterium]